MLNEKRQDLQNNRQRYESGLVKLQLTSDQVAIIKEEVKVKKVQAEQKKIQADAFAEKVGIEKEKAQIQNSKAKIEADKCAIIKKDVEQRKASTEEDLRNAEPLVEQALAALNSIEKKDFTTAKSFATPPNGVPQVFSATIWLLAGSWS